MSAANMWSDRLLRQIFRSLNRYMLLLWRLGFGPFLSLTPTLAGRYLVLTHIGRKSGLPRRTPLNFAEIQGTIYVTAGFGAVSDWYRNILANPQVELWLPHDRRSGRVEVVPDDHPERLYLLREVLKGSGFAAPLMGANPYTLSDTDLTQTCSAYRLIAIHVGEPVDGPDGPADLAWIWLVVSASLSLIVLSRRRSR